MAPSTGPLVPTTLVASVNSSVIGYNSSPYVTLTATVTGGVGSKGAPTGTIDIYRDGEDSFSVNLTSSGPNTATGTYSIPDFNNDFYFGLNQFIVVYGGDPTYQGSVSAPLQVTVVSTTVFPDFILAPQLNQLTVQSGNSANVAINLAPQNEFSGAVTLTCVPSSSQVTCSLHPSTVTVSGPATATLAIAVAAQAVGLPAHSHHPDSGSRFGWLGACGGFLFASVLVGGLSNRKRRLAMLLSLGLFAALFFAAGCGGGGQNVQPPPPPPPPNATTYSVVVSATSANGIVHNAKIAVVVP